MTHPLASLARVSLVTLLFAAGTTPLARAQDAIPLPNAGLEQQLDGIATETAHIRELEALPEIDDVVLTRDELVQRLPATFASVSAINGALTGLWVQSLPDDYYQQYTKSVMAVTAEDVLRVAKKHLDMDHLAIVIVGDRKAIE